MASAPASAATRPLRSRTWRRSRCSPRSSTMASVSRSGFRPAGVRAAPARDREHEGDVGRHRDRPIRRPRRSPSDREVDTGRDHHAPRGPRSRAARPRRAPAELARQELPLDLQTRPPGRRASSARRRPTPGGRPVSARAPTRIAELVCPRSARRSRRHVGPDQRDDGRERAGGSPRTSPSAGTPAAAARLCGASVARARPRRSEPSESPGSSSRSVRSVMRIPLPTSLPGSPGDAPDHPCWLRRGVDRPLGHVARRTPQSRNLRNPSQCGGLWYVP